MKAHQNKVGVTLVLYKDKSRKGSTNPVAVSNKMRLISKWMKFTRCYKRNTKSFHIENLGLETIKYI